MPHIFSGRAGRFTGFRKASAQTALASSVLALGVIAAPPLVVEELAAEDLAAETAGAVEEAADRAVKAAKASANSAAIKADVTMEMTITQYPETRRDDVVDMRFGETIADPYRWLENDVRTDPEVADWVARENQLTDRYLEQLPGNKAFKQSIAELTNYERFGLPEKAGNRYFYTRNSGLQNQAQLFVQDGLDGERRLLLDPNSWADDGATALAGWEPSPDGNFLLYSVQDGGTDWRILRVVDAKTGKPLEDEVRWAKFTGLKWVGEEGFLYSRFPEPEDGEDFQALNYNQAVYFHRLGTPQSEDELVYATPDNPKAGHTAQVSDDQRWVVITSSEGTDSRYEVHAIDLEARDGEGWEARPLITGFDHAWNFVEALDGKLYFVTNKDAPLYRLVSVDPTAETLEWTTLLPEGEMPIEDASLVGDVFVVSFLKDAQSTAQIIGVDGKPRSEIALDGIGTASGFGGKPGDPETFYSFQSFNRPSTIYRLDLSTGKSSIFAEPKLSFNPDDYVVEQVFYNSKDGTEVPMFIVRSRALAESNSASPTILYGYGGFDISLTPVFSPSRMAWMKAGGTFALANIRGGGEYGKEWHDAGRLDNKQNVFDDFIAAGEYLKGEGYTPANGLAIQGGSNGGLLVGAVTNQRPDLFDAANPAVGVMDMLRFTNWTAGRYWVDDYGDPAVEADFKVLRRYSPYHNIDSGREYPAILVTTADTDDRVVPGHSFKYAAALQNADIGDKPHLIRIETRAGHGSGKPTDKAIDEYGDILSFLAYWTGLEVSAP